MKKFLLLGSILAFIGFTFASESFPAFPMTIYGNANLEGGTLKVYDGLNHEISSYEITSAGRYGSENAFVLPLSLNSFEGGLSFKAIYNGQEYILESIDDSNKGEGCPRKNSITFVSENCRYDLTFQGQGKDSITFSKPKLRKDNCPNGDKSDSYYDGTCEANSARTHNSANELDPKQVMSNGYTREMNDAYEFAYENGITTMKSINQADMYGSLTRIAMAKMLSQYAINVLGKEIDTSKRCDFGDVTMQMDSNYNNGVTLACQLGIMGVGITNFRPKDTVTRAEFGTALSRMLYGLADGKDKYYTTHLVKLKQEGIISNDNPALEELRGYVMLMLMRSAK